MTALWIITVLIVSFMIVMLFAGIEFVRKTAKELDNTYREQYFSYELTREELRDLEARIKTIEDHFEI